MKIVSCRHCGKAGRNKSKGLCWRCADKFGHLYKSLSEFGRRSEAALINSTKLAKVATSAIPGSEEKIQVMERRVERGEAVCHPLDAKRSQE